MPKHALMAGAFLVLGCVGSESPVAPDDVGAPALALITADHTVFSEPVTVLVPNFCTGEWAVLSGRVHTITRTAEHSGGGFQSISHISFDLSGFGVDTGDLYTLKETNTVVARLKADGNGETFTQVIRTRLHRQGQPTKATFVFQTHFVEHADGTRSVDRIESSIEC
jgi:hypothetical protein